MKLLNKIFIKTQQFELTILYISLCVSLLALVIYLLDFNLNDRSLFILLAIIRYSSFILCICSFYKMLVNIYHIIRRPSFLRVMKGLLYVVFIFYGVIVILLETVISVIAGGNA
ncbi:MAG: hypothetical protein FWC19_04210 [Treponema sp.]|nr:hypothetical protein [Treponema sp.]MCL2271996.1 hypothetical protein [Treponema sp.]